ncbi:MAG: hypothetical protein COV80_02130 [Parcubacteria group bacterium CG11_big_fil_rev_8_21_14_0_20_48_46]|nr:MAG: hypothetical protein COV80_02130 [Parcubacteria group bacterium CG11_big_fil_rev_8_21_14_0_20_48_46]
MYMRPGYLYNMRISFHLASRQFTHTLPLKLLLPMPLRTGKKHSYRERTPVKRSYTNPFFRSKERLPIRLFADIFSLMAVFAVLLWVLLWSPFFRVQTIEVSRVTLSTAEEITEAIALYVGNAHGYIPRDALFILRERDLEQHLKQLFPIDKITVHKELPHSLRVAITETAPAALVQVADRSSYVTAEGVVFFVPTRPYPSLDESIPHIVLQLRSTTTDAIIAAITEVSLPTATGTPTTSATKTPDTPFPFPNPQLPDNTTRDAQVIAKNVVAHIILFDALLRTSDVRAAVYTIDLPIFDSYRVTTSENWTIQVSFTDTPSDQTERLKVLLDREIGRRRSTLINIDLRFGSRVFYES